MTMNGPAANGTAEPTEQVKETATQLAGQAAEHAKPAIENQKERAAGSLGTAANALRQTSQHLREQDQGTVAQYIEQAAGRVEDLAGYLRQRNLDDLITDAQRLARRQPEIFLGGAFALGLLGARFLKSSSQRAAEATHQRGTGSAGSWPPPYRYGSMPSTSSGTRRGSPVAATGAGMGPGAGSPGATGDGWVSRDERASAGLAETSPAGPSATPAQRNAGFSPGEVAR